MIVVGVAAIERTAQRHQLNLRIVLQQFHRLYQFHQTFLGIDLTVEEHHEVIRVKSPIVASQGRFGCWREGRQVYAVVYGDSLRVGRIERLDFLGDEVGNCDDAVGGLIDGQSVLGRRVELGVMEVVTEAGVGNVFQFEGKGRTVFQEYRVILPVLHPSEHAVDIILNGIEVIPLTMVPLVEAFHNLSQECVGLDILIMIDLRLQRLVALHTW